jgi:hypothetical protein
MNDEQSKNGVVDLETVDLAAMGVPAHLVDATRERLTKFATTYEGALERHIAAPGTFNLPALLEEKRLEWKIPDGAFRVAGGVVYDRILIWQIPHYALKREDGDKFGGAGGQLYKSDQTKEKETREAPRGIILGAGLKALDSLRSHGIDIGHTVLFCKNTVYSIKVDYIAGKDERVSLARETDIVASEELAAQMASGERQVIEWTRVDKDGVEHVEHLLVGENGVPRERMLPPANEGDL